jgi:hypothetical protein
VQPRRHSQSANRSTRCNGELNANSKTAFEYGQRLIGSLLLKVDWGWEDEFLHRDAIRRLDRELCRDEQRIAGLVRLNVEAVWKRNAQSTANDVTGVGAVAFKNGRQVRLDPLQLRVGGGELSATEDTEDTQKTP